MRETQLIFVEGIIGAGKSTTAKFIARQLRQNGITAHYVFEGGNHHPTRLMRTLPHPFAPWRDLTSAEGSPGAAASSPCTGRTEISSTSWSRPSGSGR